MEDFILPVALVIILFVLLDALAFPGHAFRAIAVLNK